MSLLTMKARARPQQRKRLELDLAGRVVYAIGDVHGCIAELLRLEDLIRADSACHPGPKVIIYLGDYVDRGPNSRAVLSHLNNPPADGIDRICLAGNHDIAMLDYLEGSLDLDDWLALGAKATLYSYGLDVEHLSRLFKSRSEIDAHIRASIPVADAAFLRALAVLAWSDEYIFVHAGLRPGVPLNAQTDSDLTTIRDEFLYAARTDPHWIVHGHTPVVSPEAVNGRIGIDTSACTTGRLTAVRLIGTRGKFITV